MILDQLGIIGWEDLEPIILAAMAKHIPILLVGPHGTNKSDGIERLFTLAVGGEFVQKYDTPNICADDLLGYPNPKALADGKQVSFVPTPLSIWGKRAAIFDEINAENPQVTAKILELVRTRRVMGLTTKLQYVAATANPPGDYDVSYMNPQTVSRFVWLTVPHEFSASELRTIITCGNRRNDDQDLGGTLAIRSTKEIRQRAISAVLAAAAATGRQGAYVAPREFSKLYQLLKRMLAFQQVGLTVSRDSFAAVVAGCIPGCSKLVRRPLPEELRLAAVMAVTEKLRLKKAPRTKPTTGDFLGIVLRGEALAVQQELRKIRDPEKLRNLFALLNNRGDSANIHIKRAKAGIIQRSAEVDDQYRGQRVRVFVRRQLNA